MNSSKTFTIEQEVNRVFMEKPHVVILGAGASRACCPTGDRNGRILPLMNDLAGILDLESIFDKCGIDINQNFEDAYSDLYESGETTSIIEIENTVYEYFSELKVPDNPTIYDHLLLSLRESDLIASFNWDPLLLQSYLRNQKGTSLPKLVFLHGNVKKGYCKNDRISGFNETYCSYCGREFTKSPLLYPVRKKSYTDNIYIDNEWKEFTLSLNKAFMITIFGYSGPKTDVEAISAMSNAWGDINDREMEQTEFITIQRDDEITSNWDAFIHTHHYEIHDDFYDSWIANHPRRTGEAYWHQYYDASFIQNNPIPKNYDFPDLWKWYEQFRSAEDKSR